MEPYLNPAQEGGRKRADSGRGGVILDDQRQREESEVRREALPISRGLVRRLQWG